MKNESTLQNKIKELESEIELLKKSNGHKWNLYDVLDNLFEGYQIIDNELRYVYLNKVALIHSQKEKDELIGRKMIECYPGIENTKIYQLIKECLYSGKNYNLINEFAYPNGEIGWFEISIQPIEKGVFILSNDITHKKKFEQEILKAKELAENSEMQFKKAQQTAKVGNWVWDIKDDKLTWSDEMYRIFDLDKDSFTGKLDDVMQQSILEEDRPIVEESNRLVAEQGIPKPAEFRIKTRAGNIKYVLGLDDKLEVDIYDKPKRLTGIIKDITDYKIIQKELEKAKLKAEENDKFKSAFLSNMSHEIRTPMNAITGFARLLKNPSKTREEINRYSDIIISSGNHLLKLINDIIDISKIESGQMVLVKSRVNLNHLLFNLYQFFTEDLKNKGKSHINLRYVPFDRELIVIIDETRLSQILINLISNAVKFTEQGIIEFGFKLIGDKIEFYVKDSGIGISDDKKEIIFDRFRQANPNTEKLYGGNGLGLAISKACVKLMSGDIRVITNELGGSTFFFTISHEKSQTKSKIQTQENLDSAIKFNNELIVIAEDDDNNYLYLETILSDSNLNLLRTSTGRDTIKEVLERDNVALVLMDIRMPDIDGIDATIEIRKHKPQIPIVAQTAYAFTHDREKFLSIGCSDYLSKPIEECELKRVLHNNLYRN